MSEQSVCHRCGYAGPEDATYCARCGGALVSPGARSTGGIDRVLAKLSPVHIGLLGLVLLALTSVFAAYLMITKLNFWWTVVLLALVLGCGCVYLGWQWSPSTASDRRIVHVLVVFGLMAALLVVVWVIDGVWLSFVTAGGGEIVYEIPGVHVEASAHGRHLFMVNVPPYWLAVLAYGVVAVVVGNLVRGTQKLRAT